MEAILSALLLVSVGAPSGEAPIAAPEPLWGEDLLIWDMGQNSTWMGPGYTYCEGMYDLYGRQYAAAVTDSSGSNGDAVKLFSSLEGGEEWVREYYLGSGYMKVTDPEMVMTSREFAPDSTCEFILMFFAMNDTLNNVTEPQGLRLALPDFVLESFVLPPYAEEADSMVSVAVVSDRNNEEIWFFAEDAGNSIWLTRSTDCGDNWTDPLEVAQNGRRPTVDYGPGGWVYMTYSRTTDNAIMCVSFNESAYYETVVTGGSASSAPVVAAEQAGPAELSIIFHDQSFNIRMAMSSDNGATWDVSSPISQGTYPYIDVFRESRRCALAYIHVSEIIYYASADNLRDLSTERPSPVSGQLVFTGGPPVVRHGVLPSQVSLFYMNPGMGSPAPMNLWFDNSDMSGVSVDPEAGLSMSVGPNPAAGAFTVELGLGIMRDCRLDVYSLDGRLVESVWSGMTDAGSFSAGGSLPPGVYSVVLRSGSDTVRRSVVRL